MENYKKAAASIAFLTLIYTAGLSVNYASAKDYYLDNNAQSDQEEVLDTFENNDYESWKNMVSKKSDLAQLISEKDFELFVQARRAARRGEYEKAIVLAQNIENDLKDKLDNKLFG